MDRVLQSKEVFALHTVDGLRPENITFGNLTMWSDKFVLLRDRRPDDTVSLVICDCERRISERHAVNQTEGAIMKPNSRILALRVGTQMQVFNIDTRERIMSYNMPEPIEFWRWFENDICAIVTGSAVYHWELNKEGNPPRKMFDRVLDGNTRILNYNMDDAKTWLMLCGCRSGASGIEGVTQLYSVERGASTTLPGFAGTFTTMPTPKDPGRCNIMCLASNKTVLFKELFTATKTDKSKMIEGMAPIQMSAPNEFPVAVHVTPHKLCCVCTSQGNFYVFDIITGAVVAQDRVSQSTVFCGVPHKLTGGVQLANSAGSIFVIGINNNTIIPYIKSKLGNVDLALRVASASGLSGVDDLFQAQYIDLMRKGDVIGSVSCCARAPHNMLRTPQVLQQLRTMVVAPGQPNPLSTYFKTMMESGKLNDFETVELSRTVVEKSRSTAYIKEQIDADKFTVTPALGQIVEPYDKELALRIFAKTESHSDVMKAFLAANDIAKAVEYCKRVNYSPDWRLELQKFIRSAPAEAVNLALALHRDMGSQPILDPLEVVDMFVSQQQVRYATQFIMEILNSKDSTIDSGRLETKLLEINLKHSPATVPEKIFSRNMYSNYDGMVLAPLCERAGLQQRAIECYIKAQFQNPDLDNLSNVRRCLKAAESLNGDWLIDFFGKLSREDSLLCFEDLLDNYQRHFNGIVVVAIKYHEGLGISTILGMLLERNLYDLVFAILGPIVSYTRDPEVHYRYIEAALELGNIDEVERMTRESPCYDFERTKVLLKSKKMTNFWPFVNICDKYDMTGEMVHYILDCGHPEIIEQYVQRRNPVKTPQVIGALMDLNVDEDVIKQILNSSGAMCPIEQLVQETENRGQLKILLPWLEARKNERKADTSIYNALGKIYIDTNNNVEEFLMKNEYYDPMVLGAYCENRNTNFAYLCYSRAHADDKVIKITTENAMWKELARYLVQRKDQQLWERALTVEPRSRERLVEAIQQVALPEATAVEEVIVTAKAFLAANMEKELTTILDQIVINGRFRSSRQLENLLFMIAIRARPDKALEYANSLDNYDVEEIGNISISAGLYEVALTVYDRKGMKKQALEVLLKHMNDLPRGRSYTQKQDEPACWGVLGAYLLTTGDVHEAIDCLIKAKNSQLVEQVYQACDEANQYEDLVRYLSMARTESRNKNPLIDTYLILTYAKTGRLQELEDFLKDARGAQITTVADRCFSDGLYDSAAVLYRLGSNFGKLALTQIKLNNLSEAVQAALKAKNVNIWKEVNRACLVAENFELARQCALHLVTRADQLSECVQLYEKGGYWQEIVEVLKAASQQPGAHMGVFTELAVLYAKYYPEKMIEHVNLYPKKINVHRALTVCEEMKHWLAIRTIYQHTEDWLAAANIMIRHPSACWEHEVFKDVVSHLGSSDIIYNGITFYITYHPELLQNYLQHVIKKIDPTRVMSVVEQSGVSFYLIRSCLEAVQERNVKLVNDTLNNMYFEEEDFVALRKSVEAYDNYDMVELAARLEKSELFEFRKIALALYRKNKRYSHAIEVAKKNKLFYEAIAMAATSKNSQICETLLRYFIDEGLQECFVSCLYVCYDYIEPHVALDLAWRKKCTESVMPYTFQVMQNFSSRLERVEKSIEEAKQAAMEKAPGAVQSATPLMIQEGGGPGGQQIPQQPTYGGGFNQGIF